MLHFSSHTNCNVGMQSHVLTHSGLLQYAGTHGKLYMVVQNQASVYVVCLDSCQNCQPLTEINPNCTPTLNNCINQSIPKPHTNF